MRKSMIAMAVGVALSGPAWAGEIEIEDTVVAVAGETAVATQVEDSFKDNSSGDERDNHGHAVADGLGNAAASNFSTATTHITDAFNKNTALAATKLVGYVSDVAVYGVGNVAANYGDANGAEGGRGGAGLGGIGVSGVSVGNDGEGGATSNASARDVSGTSRGNASGGHGGDGTGGSNAGGEVSATGGTAGAGAAGGEGGDIHVDAGSFDASANMTGTAQSAAGIAIVSNNSGAAALVQQAVTVQANLSLGHD